MDKTGNDFAVDQSACISTMNEESGNCSKCGRHATLKCSNCKLQFYCSKQHQKEDWSNHKSVCRAWEIRENDQLGRHLVATKDLKPGDLIIFELPIVWGPAAHTNERVCVGCGKQCIDDYIRCKCLWPCCSYNCTGLNDNKRHELECALLIKAKIIPKPDILLPIRMLILWCTKSKNWAVLSKLQSHEDARGPGTEAYEEMQSISQQIATIISMVPNCAEVLPKICGLIDVNALETNPPEGSVAIYQTACLLEHCCLANTKHSFVLDDKGVPRIIVKAVTSIKKGEHLSTMYTHALWSTKVRREHLLTTKYFSCRCARCTDPTEFGTHIGSLKCPCGKGIFLPNDPLDFETEWSCNVCPGMLTSSEVSELTQRMEVEIEETMKIANRNVLSNLLSRLSMLLHPGHQHCISVAHSLIQLLPPDDPQKQELCNRIIDTVTALDPYGSRLALYTAVTLRELANCTGQRKEVLLSRAVTLLRHEPPNSPGEKLMKLIESELS